MTSSSSWRRVDRGVLSRYHPCLRSDHPHGSTIRRTGKGGRRVGEPHGDREILSVHRHLHRRHDTAVRSFSHFGELTGAASEMKNFAKKIKGSSYSIDRRCRHPPERARRMPRRLHLETSVFRCDFLMLISPARHMFRQRAAVHEAGRFQGSLSGNKGKRAFPERIERAFSLLKECAVCPASVASIAPPGKRFCRAGDFPKYHPTGPLREEEPLVVAMNRARFS